MVIESKDKLDSLDDVQFYFDFIGVAAENQVFLSALKNSKWYPQWRCGQLFHLALLIIVLPYLNYFPLNLI